jgi:diacylglycerol kinase family enzyme
VVVTKRGGEARETLMSCDLEGVDGVISLGGDGTYWDVATGSYHD